MRCVSLLYQEVNKLNTTLHQAWQCWKEVQVILPSCANSLVFALRIRGAPRPLVVSMHSAGTVLAKWLDSGLRPEKDRAVGRNIGTQGAQRFSTARRQAFTLLSPPSPRNTHRSIQISFFLTSLQFLLRRGRSYPLWRRQASHSRKIHQLQYQVVLYDGYCEVVALPFAEAEN